MGLCTDATGIQFRILNASKGAAVQGSRAQIDMDAYRVYMQNVCLNTQNLTVYQDEVSSLILNDSGEVCGVNTKLGEVFTSKKVVLTTGTFMRGLIHIGENQYSAGRAWELPSTTLSLQLKNLGLKLEDLKLEHLQDLIKTLLILVVWKLMVEMKNQHHLVLEQIGMLLIQLNFLVILLIQILELIIQSDQILIEHHFLQGK